MAFKHSMNKKDCGSCTQPEFQLSCGRQIIHRFNKQVQPTTLKCFNRPGFYQGSVGNVCTRCGAILNR